MDEMGDPETTTPNEKTISTLVVTETGKNQLEGSGHSIGNGRSRSESILVTLLPLVITGATFLMSFGFQIYQQATQLRSSRESEWRKALEHIKTDEDATLAAYQMISFLNTEHSDEARELLANILPKVSDHANFDTILYNLLPGINAESQNEVLTIASALSNQLYDLHAEALRLHGAEMDSRKIDKAFDHFLDEPSAFFDEATEAPKLGETNETIWKLDSASRAISHLWATQGANHTISPKGQDLSGITFLNSDFRGVDFSEAESLKAAEFYGFCQVDENKLSSAAKVACRK